MESLANQGRERLDKKMRPDGQIQIVLKDICKILEGH